MLFMYVFLGVFLALMGILLGLLYQFCHSLGKDHPDFSIKAILLIVAIICHLFGLGFMFLAGRQYQYDLDNISLEIEADFTNDSTGPNSHN